MELLNIKINNNLKKTIETISNNTFKSFGSLFLLNFSSSLFS